MDRVFVPIIYEENPTDWLKRRVPSISVHSIIYVGQNIFHVLVTNSDAAVLREYLTRGLLPPFCRRPTNNAALKVEPGLVFTVGNGQQTVLSLQRTIDAYRLALPKLSHRSDQTYVSGKIKELEAQVAGSKL